MRAILADHAECAQFLHARGLVLEPASRDMFLDRLLPSFFAAMRLLARNADGDYSPDKWPERFPKFERVADQGLTPWMLFERWIEGRKPAASSVDRWRCVFVKLREDFPQHGAAALTPDEAQTWIRGLVNPERNARTVRGWINACRTVFRWALRHKLITSNPFADARVDVSPKNQHRETKALLAHEIKTILAAALAIGQPKNKPDAARRWCPWLCAYTGARVGEITQLRGVDVTEQDDVPVIKITPEAGTVKNKKARTVPLHEHLIAQGFLEFVRANGKGPLFHKPATSDPARKDDPTNPRKPPAVKVREDLAAWVRKLGVTDREIQPNHAWRHTFKQIGHRHDIHEGTLDAIVGHAPRDVGRGYGLPTLQDKAEALKRFPRYEVTTGAQQRNGT